VKSSLWLNFADPDRITLRAVNEMGAMMEQKPVYSKRAMGGAFQAGSAPGQASYANYNQAAVVPVPGQRTPRGYARRSLRDQINLRLAVLMFSMGAFIIALGFGLSRVDSLFLGVFVFFGLICVAVGIPPGLSTLVRGQRTQRTLDRGYLINAEILGAPPEQKVTIGQQKLWRILCRGYLPGTERPINFVTDGFTENPIWALTVAGATTFPVYVDLAKPKRYYIDDSNLRQMMGVK
jgi:hypothetical protein